MTKLVSMIVALGWRGLGRPSQKVQAKDVVALPLRNRSPGQSPGLSLWSGDNHSKNKKPRSVSRPGLPRSGCSLESARTRWGEPLA
jgi:hypothetical protein